MQSSTITMDLDIDLMGAQPALFKLYTQLAFVFSRSDTQLPSPLVEIISKGLKKLSQHFPWVAGQVVNVNTATSAPPLYKIRPFEETPRLLVKDYTNDESVPSFAQMEAAGYPMSMLQEDRWAPCPTLAGLGFGPRGSSGSADELAPVMMVQLSFIRGGLVMCINMQHNTCDMLGQAAVMQWFSKICSGEQLTGEELRLGKMARKGLVPLCGQAGWSHGAELNDQLLVSEPVVSSDASSEKKQADTMPSSSPKCSWNYFNFASSSLEELKQQAMSELPGGSAGFVSTDDALSAFIYQSVLRVRQERLPPDQSITFARAVDARRYLNIDAAYPGILQNMAYTHLTLADLLSLPLGHVAATLRQQVDINTSDVAHRTRSLLTYLSQSPEHIRNISFTARCKANADIMLSSWTKIQAYKWTFGLDLGRPITVRRPGFVPVESLMYIMPKDDKGSVAVAMCLRDVETQRLCNSAEWCQFATYVG
ncbi:acetyltransferase [Boeremia exigua]|uniref:acetyltransferase n=1 Tax=Boeremia exigua TaxID=749465 RepID=UPI001E8ED0F1|nr:acetyltransferase [Boeremia exigua]KAH6633818.1 acetyltransferase [Boeremia exigua]